MPPRRADTRYDPVAECAATMSDSLISSMYAVGNVASSVALVLLNKRVFAGGFYYPMTLSCFHFAFTIIFYQLLAAFDVFKKPAIDMPQTEKFKVAFAGFASIGFMNLSLSTNSVGFYQVRVRARARARARVRGRVRAKVGGWARVRARVSGAGERRGAPALHSMQPTRSCRIHMSTT